MTKSVDTETNNENVKATRNFKSSQDIEAFYRFVHENGLRKEARLSLEAVCLKMKELSKKGKKRGRKKSK